MFILNSKSFVCYVLSPRNFVIFYIAKFQKLLTKVDMLEKADLAFSMLYLILMVQCAFDCSFKVCIV